MADPKIQIKRSSVPGKIPTTDQLALGELAVNTYDGKIYIEQDQSSVGIGTTVVVVNPWSVGTGTDTYNTYFTNGNVGIGSTTPTSSLYVVGDTYITGILTANRIFSNIYGEFTGGSISGTEIVGTGLSISGISTLGTVKISSGIVTATSGVVTYYGDGSKLTGVAASSAVSLQNSRTFEITGDVVASAVSFNGTGNVSLAATIQPNSVSLGTDTTGDYVTSISGTSNQITVSNGTGEGSTPTVAISNNPTIPGNVTITNDLQVNNNLNVTGNITIGGTSAYIVSNDFRVKDADIVVGYTTDSNGNDVSNDTTANHGGIAVASTVGTPLVQLYNVSIGETNPATYKKIMWFKSGAFSGLNTDAWLINYAVGIGSTQVPSGVYLAAGDVQFTDRDLIKVRNINSSGIITATTFVGDLTGTATTSTNLADAANITTGTINSARLSGTYSISISGTATTATNVIGGIGSLSSLTVSGISTTGNLQVGTGGTIVTTTTSGLVGIGTTNPLQTLHVQGNVLVTGVTTSSEFIGGGSDLRNLSGTHLVSYASESDVSNSAMSISGISSYYQVGILSAIGIGTTSYYGFSLAASADCKTIIIGAHLNDVGVSTNCGSVFIFDRVGNSFNQVGILSAGVNTSIGDQFGRSVTTSADGKTIVVGALTEDVGGTDVGNVYVFDRVGNTFNQVGILSAGSNANTNDEFGYSVTISDDGKTIIVGSPVDDVGGIDEGNVYVFDRIGDTFNQVGILSAGGYSGDFGHSVATSADGKTIVVGAIFLFDPKVYVFDRVGNSFNQVGILTSGLTSEFGNVFGYSVAISADGKTIVVGDIDEDIAASNAGNVFIFDRVGNSFNRVGILSAGSNASFNDNFGRSVSISADGKTIVVGDDLDDVGGTDVGNVYVFNRIGNTFNQVGILSAGVNVNTDDKFGFSNVVSADGKTIVVGARLDDIGGTDFGGVYVFDEIRQTYLHSTPSGNIGIGISTPTQKLDVNGGLRLRSGLYDVNNSVGSSGQVLTSTGGGISWGGGGGVAILDAKVYTSVGSTTWTKPSGAKIISFAAVGGGGGGASGAAAVGSGIAGGTGGGAGGSVVIYTIGADYLNATETVVVGAGGTGGTGNTRIGAAANATTNGNNGTAGSDSQFGPFIAGGGGGGEYTTTNNTVAYGGNPDAWVAPTVTRAATTGVTITESKSIIPYVGVSGAGGSGAATDKAPAAVAAVSTTDPTPSGGGYGGTPGTLTTSEDGGAGANAGTSVGIVTGGAGGIATSINGKNGGSQLTTYDLYAAGGGGGYGAYVASGIATGGVGGNGGFPGGGGGGGGSGRVNTNTNPNTAIGGTGGNGGNGVVIVITYG